ncbi:MAG TPA: FGGY-family carbohydrate kinase [Acidobacteriota bacterium]|nr:FGGY-family carbohydrate kinase [Acidobacteriota bacterium]
MSLLGLDIGTSGCKAAAFDQQGKPLAYAYREYPLHSPAPGRAELDPEEVWQAVLYCLGTVAQKTRNSPPRAMAFSSQGEAVIPLDQGGQPLANSIVTFDSRARQQTRRLRERIGDDRFFDITGVNLHSMVTVAKIAWWKDNDPELFSKARQFLCFPDFVLQRLGLPPSLDPSMAARTGGYHQRRGEWSEEVLEALHLDPRTLPSVAASGSVLGRLGRKGGELTGLPEDTLVVSGGHDQCCAALGAGVVEAGQVLCGLGTVEAFIPVSDQFQTGLGRRGFPCYPHVVPSKRVTAAFNFTGGVLLRWFRDRFFPDEGDDQGHSYQQMLADLPQEPTSLLVLPYFTMSGTPWFDDRPRGSIIGLSLETGRSEIVKALIEGLACEMTLNLQLIAEAGLDPSRPRAVGGGTRSPQALQIRADVLGRAIEIPQVTEGAALGAALLAGAGAGIYDDLAAAAAQLVGVERVVEPDPGRHEFYAAQMQRYRKLYGLIRQLGD